MDWTQLLPAFVPPSLLPWLTVIVTIASALANVIPPYTIVGKVLHFFALNFKTGNLSSPELKDQNSQPGGGA
jgi:hypothetical protein